MHRLFFFCLMIFLSYNVFAQIEFESGYFINNEDERIDCLIKNADWKNNPKSIQFRLPGKTEIKTTHIDLIKEFGIDNYSKYERHLVKIDTSSNIISELSFAAKPEFQETTVFLKVLIEGPSTLYSYENNKFERFFFKVGDSEIEQLIYKKYKVDNGIGTNDAYKNQLWDKLECEETFTIKSFTNLGYYRRQLVNVFGQYNECKKGKSTTFEKTGKKDLFRIGIRPGLNYSKVRVYNNASKSETDFGNQLNLRLGAEFEFILPFNKNKWGILFEPTYKYYKSDIEILTTLWPTYKRIDYSVISFPLGIRHYFFINDESKVYLNGLINFLDIEMKSEIDYPTVDFEIDSQATSFGLGVGFKYKDRYSAEFRYNFRREILSDYAIWNGWYENIGLIIGYSIYN